MAEDSFHHRSNFANKRKAHKIKGKSKPSAESKLFGRVDKEKVANKRAFRPCHQFRDIGKSQRKANAKEKRKAHREQSIKNKLKYYGKTSGGTPKIIALISLSPYSETQKIKKHLLRHCNVDNTEDDIVECQSVIGGNKKSNFIIFECNNRNDTFSVLDICKIADIILLVASPSPKPKNNKNTKWNDCILGLDKKSQLFCSIIKSVGGAAGASIYGLYQPKFYKNLSKLSKNNKSQQCKVDTLIKTTFKNYLLHEFGSSNNSKNIRIFHCYDMEQLFRFMHSDKNYKDINSTNCAWKQKRPHLLVQKIRKIEDRVSIEGYLRGSIRMNVNRPIHLTGFGDYLVDEIDGLLNRERYEKNEDVMDVDDDGQIALPLIRAQSECQDDLSALGTLDGLAAQFDQTLITEHELKEIEEERLKRINSEMLSKRGLSDYNLEWIEDEKDANEDDDIGMDIDAINEDDDDDGGRQSEFEFDDEVETPTNMRAKDSFAQYRGLKQFYKTKWDKFELLPIEYSRIASIKDWKKAIKVTRLQNMIKSAEDNEEDNDASIECGKKVRIYLKDMSEDVVNKLFEAFGENKPLIAWSLLQHENKVSVCHYLVQKHHNCKLQSIEALKPYIFDVGFRRFRTRPIFSDNSRANKHLIKRSVNDKEFFIASVYGQISYPPIGVLMFEQSEEENEVSVCCHGSVLNVDAHRLLIERKVLTGSAIRVQRRRAVIRYMFWNSEDVKYFKPIDLWTKHGLKGKIEEPVGDKGLFKAFFNGHLKQNDTVCLSLYKRVFPYKDEQLFC